MQDEASSDPRSTTRWRRRAREVVVALVLTLAAIAFLIVSLSNMPR